MEKTHFDVTTDSMSCLVVAHDDNGNRIYVWGEKSYREAEKKAEQLNAMSAPEQRRLLLEYKADMMRDEMARKVENIQAEADRQKLALERQTQANIDALWDQAAEDPEFREFLNSQPHSV